MPWRPRLCPEPHLESLITAFPKSLDFGERDEKENGKIAETKRETKEGGKEIKKRGRRIDDRSQTF